jgi:uncharacterized protein (DUF2147 family)
MLCHQEARGGEPYKYIVMIITFFKVRTASISILLFSSCWAAGTERSPVGLWKTFDDHTHQARGTIRIFEENGSLSGKIETSFKPEELTERCDKCSDDRKDAPIIGLTIMRGMKKAGSTKDAGEYGGGEILDPDTGSVYRCKMALSGDGEKLFVRGYLGFSILGRTQTWVRAGF